MPGNGPFFEKSNGELIWPPGGRRIIGGGRASWLVPSGVIIHYPQTNPRLEEEGEETRRKEERNPPPKVPPPGKKRQEEEEKKKMLMREKNNKKLLTKGRKKIL